MTEVQQIECDHYDEDQQWDVSEDAHCKNGTKHLHQLQLTLCVVHEEACLTVRWTELPIPRAMLLILLLLLFRQISPAVL